MAGNRITVWLTNVVWDLLRSQQRFVHFRLCLNWRWTLPTRNCHGILLPREISYLIPNFLVFTGHTKGHGMSDTMYLTVDITGHTICHGMSDTMYLTPDITGHTIVYGMPDTLYFTPDMWTLRYVPCTSCCFAGPCSERCSQTAFHFAPIFGPDFFVLVGSNKDTPSWTLFWI